jgi:hypothetical protein
MIKTITNGSTSTPANNSARFLPEQVLLQTYLLNNLVPKRATDFARGVAYWRNPSAKQLDSIKKLISEVQNKPQPAANTATPGFTIDLSKIVNMMESAGQKLKRPKVSLQTANNIKVRITRSGGKIYLNEAGFGSRFWGSIESNGALTLTKTGKQYATEIENLLVEFAKDPVTVARNYGKLMGSCCFCSLPLNTEESLHAGYGPVCAEHFHLPWGEKVNPAPDKFVNVVEKRMTANNTYVEKNDPLYGLET